MANRDRRDDAQARRLIEPISADGRMPVVIARERQGGNDALLLIGAVAAAAVTFRPWGVVAPLLVAAVTVAIGVGRRLPFTLSLAAASAAAAGFVHFAVAPEHFAEWWGFGTFFVLCGEVQVGWALLVRRARGRLALSVGLVGSMLLIVLWAVSRTTGLPLGPEPGVPEPVGTADVLAIALEAVTAGSCLWALVERRASRFPWPIAAGALALTAAAAALALLSIT
jgi:hypothetical protein